MKPPYLLQSSMPLLCSLPPIRHRRWLSVREILEMPKARRTTRISVKSWKSPHSLWRLMIVAAPLLREATRSTLEANFIKGKLLVAWIIYLKACQKAPSKLFGWHQNQL